MPLNTIHIHARDIVRYDAIGNFCMQLYTLLTNENYDVRLWAESSNYDRDFIEHRKDFLGTLKPDDLIFFNYSIEDPLLELMSNLPNFRIAYFHNITPPEELEPDDYRTVGLCRRGLQQVSKLGKFDRLMANSGFTADMLLGELEDAARERHENKVAVCPPLIGADRWSGVHVTEQVLNSGATSMLYIGRLVRHKGVREILDIAQALSPFMPQLEVNIVGGPHDGPYPDMLRERAREIVGETGITIEFHHNITDEQLKALYLKTSFCIAHSRHEGFCVPALDALYFDKPMFTTEQGAILEVLGPAARVIPSDNPAAIASTISNELAKEAISDEKRLARHRRYEELKRLADGHLIVGCVKSAKEPTF